MTEPVTTTVTTTAASTATATATPAGSPPRRAFGFWLGTLRVLAVLHAAILIGQPLSIGQYLGGLYTWLGIHSAGATAVVLISFLLAVTSIGYALTGGRIVVPIVCWLLLFAEIVQTGMGYARVLAVHIPLGVFVVTAGVLVAVWSLSRAARRCRHRGVRPVAPVTGEDR
jgi:hypothetical protein